MKEQYNALNEQISEIVSQKMHHFREIQRLDRLINKIKGTNYNIPERVVGEMTESPTQEIAPHPWKSPIMPSRWEVPGNVIPLRSGVLPEGA